MVRILVRLPNDRDYAGSLHLEGDDGSVIAGPFEVCGRADDASARVRGNPRRERILPGGDTPLGRYRVATEVAGEALPAEQFGPHGVLVLEPMDGEAALADANGRFRLLIQGGSSGPGRLLRPTNGSLRLANRHMRVLIRAVSDLGAIECHCVSVPPTEGARALAIGIRCDDGDPPGMTLLALQPVLSGGGFEPDEGMSPLAKPADRRRRFQPPIFRLIPSTGGDGGGNGAGGSSGSGGDSSPYGPGGPTPVGGGSTPPGGGSRVGGAGIGPRAMKLSCGR